MVEENNFESDLDDARDQSRTAVATPIQNENGDVLHLVMDCLDTNFSIPQNEERSEPPTDQPVSAVSPFLNGCILLDRDMSIILFNSGIKSLIEHNGSELIGRNLFTVVPFYNRPEIRNRLEVWC